MRRNTLAVGEPLMEPGELRAAMAEKAGGGGGEKQCLRTKMWSVAGAAGSYGGFRASERRNAGRTLAGGIRPEQLSARKLGARLWKLQDTRRFAEPNARDFPSHFSYRRESEYGSRTAAEQLEVLERISLMEEHQAHIASLIEEITAELSRSRSDVREMKRMMRANDRELKHPKARIVDTEPAKKAMGAAAAAVLSMNSELRKERKLRRRPESSGLRMSLELAGLKCAFSKAMEDLEEQIRANINLGELCEEFAGGVTMLPWPATMPRARISEGRRGLFGKVRVIDRSSRETVAFLRARRSVKSEAFSACHRDRKNDV